MDHNITKEIEAKVNRKEEEEEEKYLHDKIPGMGEDCCCGNNIITWECLEKLLESFDVR